MICWGFPWKIPQAALDVPRLGSINLHPALLPAPSRADPAGLGAARRRCRLGLRPGTAWTPSSTPGNMLVAGLRADRGRRRRHRGVRARSSVASGVELLAPALERVAAGDPGDPQPEEGASWAGHFEDDDYVHVDWSTVRPVRSTTRCGPGTWSSASRASARRRPSSTASRSSCGRRGSPTRAAAPSGSSAATARSGSSRASRL